MTHSNHYCERCCDFEFLEGADNVYRTENFIVRQVISIVASGNGDAHLMSEDTYFYRTKKRDEDYDFAFRSGRANVDGKRMRVVTYTRKYID